jgi:hypothetical protein
MALGPVVKDARSSARENNWRIWLKMLDTRITALAAIQSSQRKP